MNALLSNKKLIVAVIVVISIGVAFKYFLLGLIPIGGYYIYNLGKTHGHKKGYDIAKEEDQELLNKVDVMLLKYNFIENQNTQL